MPGGGADRRNNMSSRYPGTWFTCVCSERVSLSHICLCSIKRCSNTRLSTKLLLGNCKTQGIVLRLIYRVSSGSVSLLLQTFVSILYSHCIISSENKAGYVHSLPLSAASQPCLLCITALVFAFMKG